MTDIIIRPISAANFADLEALFVSEKQCAECWCMNHRHAKDAPTGESAKVQLKDLVKSGKAHGLLAYRGAQCVGWCAVDPLSAQPGHDYVIDTGDANQKTWSIHCLYVHPQARSIGVSSQLVEAAVKLAEAEGAARILAFPIPEQNRGKFSPNEAEFSGRFSTFLKRGFAMKKQLNDFYSVVAKDLTRPAYKLLDWDDCAAEADAFLQSRYETSLFLLGNLESFGSRAGESPNSGNFKAVKLDGKVVAAFCLTKRGNLLVQGGSDPQILDAIAGSAAGDNLRIGGILGPWEIAAPLWDLLSTKGLVGKSRFYSKERLYRRNVLENNAEETKWATRLLAATDYEQWRPLRIAYLEGEGLPQDLSDEEFKKSFFRLVESRVIWGAFSGDRLIGLAGLNTKAKDIGQVGGVYTTPEFRGQGVGRAVMDKMTEECRSIHKLTKLILFTGDQNIAAQRLYHSLGYERCGDYGLIFS